MLETLSMLERGVCSIYIDNLLLLFDISSTTDKVFFKFILFSSLFYIKLTG